MGTVILVFDLGTDTAAMALVADGEVRFLAEPGTGLLNWSSAICLDEDEVVVGTAAENRRQSRPVGYRAEIKRDLGRGPVRLGDRDVEPLDLVVAVLRQARTVASRDAGVPVDHVLLTVPASYGPGDPRWDLMIAAGEAAGFTVVELITEPVAAALAPVAGPAFPPGSLILVYDLGGGTFDTALVRAGQEGPLRTGSVDGCAGRDLDAAIFADLAGQLGVAATGQTPLDLLRRTQLADLVRLLKHDLTDRSRATFVFAGTGETVTYERERLEAHAAPLLKATVDCCRRVLADAGVEPGQLHGVVLAGGVTRMPLVGAYVGEALGVPVQSARDPQFAVAAGAGRYAAGLSDRLVTGELAGAGAKPVRWNVPGGTGTLLAWTVTNGESYRAGQVLGRVRTHEGGVWGLAAPADGVVLERHADPGDLVHSGDWLVTSGRSGSPSAASQFTYRLLGTYSVAGAKCAGLLPDGRLVAAAIEDHELRVVTPESGEVLIGGRSVGEASEIQLDPQVTTLFLADGERYGGDYDLTAIDLTSIPGSSRGSVRLRGVKAWSVLDADHVIVLENPVLTRNWSVTGPSVIRLRDGTTVGSPDLPMDLEFGSGARIVASKDELWLLRPDRGDMPTKGPAMWRNPYVKPLAATSDRAFFLAYAEEWVVVFRMTDTQDYTSIGRLGHSAGVITSAYFSPDDRQLVIAGGNEVTHWEIEWPT
ncbi:Hsp70 family protein [Actinoplanes bogorensis]|uniref:Hsp70 family protein n=1 Tax=Paractinoplanes bogorensis TaxID=1610840 RepID=A0ABS5YUP1_9ACTN|nr:Hsp70 family protein [Actinoplanes bogorensis]MBU2667167.1 Hsp70 family protein [Actinoplanes bogorensis]